MFVFQLVDKIEEHKIMVKWYTNNKQNKIIKANLWNLPWYIYFRRVNYLDFAINKDGLRYWILELK